LQNDGARLCPGGALEELAQVRVLGRALGAAVAPEHDVRDLAAEPLRHARAQAGQSRLQHAPVVDRVAGPRDDQRCHACQRGTAGHRRAGFELARSAAGRLV